MFDALIKFSLRQRGFVLLALIGIAAAGGYSLLHLPIDALPDITNVQVMALTDAPALGPEEVEQFITIPVENAMNGIPRIQEVRSITQFGFSSVTVVFQEGTDIYWARQQIGERLNQVREEIPEGFGRPVMGPIATGLGEIYQFEVKNASDPTRERSLMELRTILEWDISRPLLTVPGVIEVNTFGGELKTYQVEVDPILLAARGIGVNQVYLALQRNNSNAGGEVRSELESRQSVEAIRNLEIADPQGRMIPLEDLTDITFDDGVYEIWRKDRERRAMITVNVRGRDLAGFVADAKQAVAQKLDLPEGYRLHWGGTFENLESASRRLMVVVPLALVLIFLLLDSTFGSIRLGLLIFLSVPLGAVGGVLALWLRGIDFSISAGVGFIALSGVAVLDGLVLVSAIRHLIEDGAPSLQAVHQASMSRLRPILMTGLVASLGFVPMAFSQGSGAEVQRPLATVVIGGLLTSMFLKLVVLPAIYPWFDPGVSPPDDDDEEASPALSAS